ncbi:hypothetical protein [uncultured Methanoregula sp.]|uniref:hypothetical protein n=1 Tax=uncultured Methanoregula sp. TaxID=1005933 RepID=UPI002AAAB1D5|nr:hypothetical protein [uncultured Methanoregula sp.]
MGNDTLSQFTSELKSFFMLVLLNMTFGALAMAFGMQYMIMAVIGLPLVPTTPALRMLAGVISMVGFGLGLMWILTSAKVHRGIKGIRREFRSHEGPVPDEMLTGWIVRLLANYREHKRILPWMITISRLGGCCFVTLGIVNILQGIAAGNSGGNWMEIALPFGAAAINLTIGLVTIAISIGFHRYSRAWDQRLDAAALNESILERALEER